MDCSFTIEESVQIKMETYDGVMNSAKFESGEMIGFKMDRKYQDNPQIADDEMQEILMFELPAGESFFHYEDENLAKLKTVFATLAYSRDGGWYEVKEGCLEGLKHSGGAWQVKGNLVITTRTNRKIKKLINASFK